MSDRFYMQQYDRTGWKPMWNGEWIQTKHRRKNTMSISYTNWNHRNELHIFGLTQIKITLDKSSISDRDMVRIDWTDNHDKPCRVEFFLDEKASKSKGSIQATKELRKLIATASE